jgi:hypothetical protein
MHEWKSGMERVNFVAAASSEGDRLPHQEAMDSAVAMIRESAALIAPERTTASKVAAKAQAASVPTAYSAVVIPDWPSCLSWSRRALRACQLT